MRQIKYLRKDCIDQKPGIKYYKVEPRVKKKICYKILFYLTNPCKTNQILFILYETRKFYVVTEKGEHISVYTYIYVYLYTHISVYLCTHTLVKTDWSVCRYGNM